jgi:single-strand DNA-binding protein
MQLITISGNLGRDAELRTTQAGDDICSFSVGVRQGYGDKASSNWFRCSVWGKRARTIQQYLRKGAKVFVAGELTIGEYQGKPQYDVRVNEVEWERSAAGGEQERPATGGGRPPATNAFDDDLDDSVPFATCDPSREPMAGRRRVL